MACKRYKFPDNKLGFLEIHIDDMESGGNSPYICFTNNNNHSILLNTNMLCILEGTCNIKDNAIKSFYENKTFYILDPKDEMGKIYRLPENALRFSHVAIREAGFRLFRVPYNPLDISVLSSIRYGKCILMPTKPEKSDYYIIYNYFNEL